MLHMRGKLFGRWYLLAVVMGSGPLGAASFAAASRLGIVVPEKPVTVRRHNSFLAPNDSSRNVSVGRAGVFAHGCGNALSEKAAKRVAFSIESELAGVAFNNEYFDCTYAPRMSIVLQRLVSRGAKMPD